MPVPPIEALSIMLEPAAEAHDQAFLRGLTTWCMVGDRGKVARLPTGKATDQGNERVEMAFAMARLRQWKEVHERLLYGTIPTIRVTHLLLRTERSKARKSIPERARIAV